MRNSKFRWAIRGVARVQRIQSVMRGGAFAALAAFAFSASAQTGALTQPQPLFKAQPGVHGLANIVRPTPSRCTQCVEPPRRVGQWS